MTQHTHTSHGHTCCHDDEHDEHKHHNHEHNEHDHAGHSHDGDVSFLPAIISFVLLGIGLVLDNWIQPTWFTGWIRMTLYLVAYIPCGLACY
jgi:Cd2+/Zn2+-exporting ATPase